MSTKLKIAMSKLVEDCRLSRFILPPRAGVFITPSTSTVRAFNWRIFRRFRQNAYPASRENRDGLSERLSRVVFERINSLFRSPAVGGRHTQPSGAAGHSCGGRALRGPVLSHEGADVELYGLADFHAENRACAAHHAPRRAHGLYGDGVLILGEKAWAKVKPRGASLCADTG